MLVTYDGDTGWYHERLLEYPVAIGEWVIRAADNDEYADKFEVYKSAVVMSGRTITQATSQMWSPSRGAWMMRR